MMDRTTKALLCLAATVAAAGCTVGPNYRTPTVDMPLEWVGPTTQPALASAVATGCSEEPTHCA